MDRNYIDRHLLVDRYLAGDIPDEELADFEERLVWDEELIDELDLAERLREGMLAAAGEGRYAAQTESGLVPRLRLVFSNTRYAVAASFIAGIASSLFVLGPAYFSPLPEDTHYSASYSQLSEDTRYSVHELQVFRGADGPVIATNLDGISILRFEAGQSFENYAVTIQAAEGSEPLWQKGRLEPDGDGMLVVGVPGGLLPTGSYLLTVFGESDGQLVLDRHIPFETEPVR